MANLTSEDLKKLFIKNFKINKITFSEGNPFLLKLKNKSYFIFLRNITSAYHSDPDRTRVQLPRSEQFKIITNSTYPFIILGYDIENDVYVSWNHHKIKQRLNVRTNVSVYSKRSFQKKCNSEMFNYFTLTMGEKVVIFKSKYIEEYLLKIDSIFKNDYKTINSENENTQVQTTDIMKIFDEELIKKIKPMLIQKRILEAVTICTQELSDKYKDITLKDWFRLVETLRKEISE